MAGRVESEYRQVFSAQDRTGRAFRSLNSNLKQTGRGFSALQKGVAGLAAALSVTAITRFAKSTADLARGLQDAADKTGLAVESFQAYQQVAAEGGINSRSFEMALQRLTRRIGEAAIGQGELLKVVQNYGLAIRDVSGNIRSTEDVLFDLADIIRETESAQEQLFLTTRAFDAEGADFVNILRDGATALKAAKDEAEAFGVAGAEDVAVVSELAKEFDQWAQILKTKTITALAGAAAGIKSVSDALQDLFTTTNVEELARLGNSLARLEESVAGREGRRLSGRQRKLDRDQRRQIAQLKEEIKLIQERMRARREAVSAPSVGAPAAPVTAAPTAPAVAGNTPFIDAFLSERAQTAENSAAAAFAQSWRDSTKQVVEDAQDTFMEVNRFAQRAAENLQDVFADFFFDPLEKGFDGLAESFARMIQRMVAELAAQQFLTGAFSLFKNSGGVVGNFARQALSTLGGGNVIINAPGADAAAAARIEAVGVQTQAAIRDNARRGRLT